MRMTYDEFIADRGVKVYIYATTRDKKIRELERNEFAAFVLADALGGAAIETGNWRRLCAF